MTISIRRNILELAELGDDIQDIESLKLSFNETITELNFVLRSLTLTNLDGEIVTATIPAGGSVKIPHKLRIIPTYRIILGQTGGGVITDVGYSSTYVELENGGVDDALITIIIVKD